MYRNNESVTPNPRSPLEDYSLHIIDLHTGRLSDTRSFKCDKIILSHNQGLYLYRNILAVLSVQQQTIHVFQVGRVNTYDSINFGFDYKYSNKKKKKKLPGDTSGDVKWVMRGQRPSRSTIISSLRSSSARALPNDHQQAASVRVF